MKRVSEVYKTINEKGADKYITAIILNAVSYFEALSKKHNMQLALNKRKEKKKKISQREKSKYSNDELYDNPALAFA